MKFKIIKIKQAEKEFETLSEEQKSALNDDYNLIENEDIAFVKRRHLQDEIYEIKTNDVRSLFKYEENQIIIIGLIYEKRTNKAPQYYIKLAKKRLREENIKQVKR